MRKILVLLVIFCLSFPVHSEKKYRDTQLGAISIGLLHGGGLLGLEFEQLVSSRIGVQIGLGVLGYNFGANYHLRETVRSPFISLEYQHYGLKFENMVIEKENAILTLTYVYRSRHWFICGLGLGYALDPDLYATNDEISNPVMLVYTIGVYIPWN